jgi:hypothetical protein
MLLSGALSKSITAFPFGFTDRAPPQYFPDVSVRIHIDPLPLGVNNTSDLWPTFKQLGQQAFTNSYGGKLTPRVTIVVV